MGRKGDSDRAMDNIESEYEENGIDKMNGVNEDDAEASSDSQSSNDQQSEDEEMSESDASDEDEEKPKKKVQAKKNPTAKSKAKSVVPTPTPIRARPALNGVSTPSSSLSTPSTSLGKRGMLGAKLRMTPATPALNKPFSLSQPHTPATQSSAASLKAKLQARSQHLKAEWATQSRCAENVDAMLKNKLSLRREPLMPDLTVKGAEKVVSEQRNRVFEAPRQDTEKMSASALQLLQARTGHGRRLGVRMTIFSGVIKPFAVKQEEDTVSEMSASAPSLPPSAIGKAIQDDFEPLVIWRPTEEELKEDETYRPIVVDEFLARKLRPHQREGVMFMAECVLGLKSFEGQGCILADDMGLGKTCQSVTLMYTLLRYGFHFQQPTCKRVIVVCPTSLVLNWKNEVYKWVGDTISVIALSESGKDSIDKGIADFLNPIVNKARKAAHVLVLSYDTYRRRHRKFLKEGSCDLLICDEAHRLKNAETAIYKSLNKLPCTRRVLLSGTPLQNDLSEFYAMVNFINPNVLGDERIFHSYYEHPILMGREPDALDEEREKGQQRSLELSAIVNQFVLRRTNALLSAHIPPKVTQVICCRPTELQKQIYQHICKSKAVKSLLNNAEDGRGNGGIAVLPLIGQLRNLCNHPKIVYDNANNEPSGQQLKAAFPSDFLSTRIDPRWSGKMHVLDKLLCSVKQRTDDRWVIVSNFTTTLDLMEEICKMRKWGVLRLDGSTNVKNRQKLVDELSDHSNNIYVFLLSSKAGGCGLNMIGANRLVLFDPDWNPAVDQQAAARVWRDGQKKRCFIYRFLTTGSIEEKIYQRQLTKEGLKSAIGGSTAADNDVSMAELKDLFQLQDESKVPLSDTHDTLECNCCVDLVGNIKRERKFRVRKPPKGSEKKEKDSKKDNEDGSGSGSDEDAADNDGDKSLRSSASKADGASDKENLATDDDASATKRDDFKSPSKTTKSSLHDSKVTSADNETGRQPRPNWHSKPMNGQRGNPSETELINWSHHVTVLSTPDPQLRRTYQDIKLQQPPAPTSKPTSPQKSANASEAASSPFKPPSSTVESARQALEKLWISFVFSCEVLGKAEDTEKEMMAARVSAICDLPPVQIKRVEQTSISAEEAQARHKEWMDRKTKKKKAVEESEEDYGEQVEPQSDTKSNGNNKANSKSSAKSFSKKQSKGKALPEESEANESDVVVAHAESVNNAETTVSDIRVDSKKAATPVSVAESSDSDEFETSSIPVKKAKVDECKSKPSQQSRSQGESSQETAPPAAALTSPSGRPVRTSKISAADAKLLCTELKYSMSQVKSMDFVTQQAALVSIRHEQEEAETAIRNEKAKSKSKSRGTANDGKSTISKPSKESNSRSATEKRRKSITEILSGSDYDMEVEQVVKPSKTSTAASFGTKAASLSSQSSSTDKLKKSSLPVEDGPDDFDEV